MSTGSAQQTSTTTAGVSPFAQNYVDTMLSAGQQQVFNTQPNAAGGMDITGIKPYVPFGAPMNAQGQVAPYGGQQTGMGWGAYGQQQQQAPMGGMGPQSGYGSMASIIEQPQQNANLFDLFKTMGDRVRQPSTYPTAPAPQDYSKLGLDQNTVNYLNQQRQASASDAGIAYDYDPATQTFKGYTMSGPVTKTLAQMQQEAGGQGSGATSNPFEPIPGVLAQPSFILQQQQQQQQPPQQFPQQQQPYGYAPGTMQAGMGPGEQMAARASVAGPSALQQQAYRSASGMQTPSAFAGAEQAARQGIRGLLGADQYEAQSFDSQYRAPRSYQARDYGYSSVTAPQLQDYQMRGPERVGSENLLAPEMAAAQTGYNPQLEQFQMGPAQDVASRDISAGNIQAAQMGPAQQVSTQSFTQPGSAEAYMSPYMQNVVNAQQREAKRASDIAAQGQKAQAVQAGAFGGSRQAIVEAERQRNLATQLGDIQAQGLQGAYQQAQQQFNTEQQARLAAQQANQQAGLTVGQQNLSAQQQANVQNVANQLQAQGMSAQQAMQAALANQQAGLTTGQQNLAARLGIQQLGTQTGMQTALANLNNQQQAAVQNQAARLQTQGLSAQQAMQAALANQQAGLTTGQQNLAARLQTQQLGAGQTLQADLANQQARQAAQQATEQSRQFGYGQGMTSSQLAAQYGLAAQQAAEQSRQFGANLGLQGYQGALSGAGQLANIGNQQLGAQQSIANLQNTLGQQQQANQQQIINQAMQNYAAQRAYPQQQLSYLSSLLSGLPVSSTGQTTNIPAPSMLSQLGGLGMTGIGAAGLYKNLTDKPLSTIFSKKGGAIKAPKTGGNGLMDIALSKIGA
jgi:hypothetical protein